MTENINSFENVTFSKLWLPYTGKRVMTNTYFSDFSYVEQVKQWRVWGIQALRWILSVDRCCRHLEDNWSVAF